LYYCIIQKNTLNFGKSTSGKSWNDYTKDISLLLTGHLHNNGGDHVYAYHRDFLEMELNDFKVHGVYRIISVDHDMVSITDNRLPLPELPFNFATSEINTIINNPPNIFNQDIPPIVHITLPKNSRFNLKRGEPLKESFSSEYIRVLVFSDHPPQDLKLSLYIDGQHHTAIEFKYIGDQKLSKRSSTIQVYTRDEQNLNHENDQYTVDFKTPPLWIAKWNNSIYKDGNSHTLKVEARIVNNTVKTSNNSQMGENTISFRFDDKNDNLKGSLILKIPAVKLLPVIFGIVFLFYEATILLSRLYAIKHILSNHPDIPFFPTKYIGNKIYPEIEKFKNGGFFKRHFIGPLIETFCFDGIFYPLQILLICFLVFPAKIGVLIHSSEHFSKFSSEFLYGSLVSGQWSNICDNYAIYLIYIIIIPILNTFIIVSLNHKNDRNSKYIISLLILLCFVQIGFVIGVSLIIGGILSIFLTPFPNWIGLYCWILIYMIINRRNPNQNKKHTSLKLNPLLQV